MPGHKYICNACGITLWMPRKDVCVACGGVCSLAPSKAPQKASCAVCGNEFPPRDSRHKTCSPECSRTLMLRNAANAARLNYKGKRAVGWKPAQRDTRTPWGWMALALDENGQASQKRTILHTLEEQTAAGEWPWQDPLAGVGPSPIDECPFL